MRLFRPLSLELGDGGVLGEFLFQAGHHLAGAGIVVLRDHPFSDLLHRGAEGRFQLGVFGIEPVQLVEQYQGVFIRALLVPMPGVFVKVFFQRGVEDPSSWDTGA